MLNYDLLLFLAMTKKETMMTKRMFIALDISKADKVKVAQWRKIYLPRPFKVINEENFHITLAFLGLINQQQQVSITAVINQQHSLIQQQLQLLLSQKLALPITLSAVGYFKKAQVLHLMPPNCPNWLAYLNNVMINSCRNVGIPIENRIYKPHLSIYRKAKMSSPKSSEENIAVELQLNIRSFSLYQSYSTPLGVHYEPIQTWEIN